METEEQTNVEQQEHRISRKIEVDKPYKIFVSEYNGYKFYKIRLTQKMYDGTEFKYYQPVKFKKGIEVENETTIKILNAIENDKPNPKDKYSFIREYMILDFETIVDVSEAISDFHDTLNSVEDIEITDDMLPF